MTGAEPTRTRGEANTGADVLHSGMSYSAVGVGSMLMNQHSA